MQAIGAVLVDSELHAMIDRGNLRLPHEDVQPCSVDLRVGNYIYEITGLPDRGESGFAAKSHLDRFRTNDRRKISNSRGYVLKRKTAYLIEIDGEISLAEDEEGYTNPKSSMGRIDAHCMGYGERSTRCNVLPAGYKGRIYLVVTPQSFPIRVYPGVKMAQMRVFRGKREMLSDRDLRISHARDRLVMNDNLCPLIKNGQLILSLDLHRQIPCLVAHDRTDPIDLRASRSIDPSIYFYEKRLDEHGGLWLEPNQFMLVATREIVHIPQLTCAEMVSFSDQHGEYRSHYAGLFDRGFVNAAVCEVRNTASVPIRFSHGQELVPLSFEFLTRDPDVGYGADTLGSNYSKEVGLLAKFFKPWPPQGRIFDK